MENSRKKIVAITVAYNRKELLLKCVKSLLGQTRKPDKIYIIDNNSTDGTQEYLKQEKILDNETIRYVRLQKNIGSSGGFFTALKLAYEDGFDYFWLMDDDVECAETALEELLKAEKIVGSFGFLCSKVVGMTGESMNLPEINSEPGMNGYPEWAKYLQNAIIKVKSCTFVSVLFPRSIITEVGYPIKEFFIWGDDTEYTSRASLRHESFMVANSIVVHNRKNQGTLNIFNEGEPERIKNYFYLYRNSMYILMHRGTKKRVLSFVFDALLKSLKCILKGKHGFKKSIVIMKGSLGGLFFNPKIALPQGESKS